MIKPALTAALLAAVIAAAAPAHAQDVRSVSYGDLDLASAEGRAVLDQRIELAVKAVCAPDLGYDMIGLKAARKCGQLATIDARRAVERAIARNAAKAEQLAARR